MMFLWLADLVALVHGAIVAAVVLGALAALMGRLCRFPLWERAYYGLLIVVIAANAAWGECPLTRWEQGLRNCNQPGSAYCNSFIGHYLPMPPPLLGWIGPSLIGGAFLAAPLWRLAGRGRRRA